MDKNNKRGQMLRRNKQIQNLPKYDLAQKPVNGGR